MLQRRRRYPLTTELEPSGKAMQILGAPGYFELKYILLMALFVVTLRLLVE